MTLPFYKKKDKMNSIACFCVLDFVSIKNEFNNHLCSILFDLKLVELVIMIYSFICELRSK